MEPRPYPDPEPPLRTGRAQPEWRSLLGRLWAPIALAVGLFLKFGAASIKFFGVFISIGGYALLWGWQFGVGIVALIFVHEMGHYLEAKRQGLDPSAPVFVPFLGAYVAMKNAPDDPWRNALVSLAGPALGGIGAAGVWFLGEYLDSRFLIALAFTAFMLNLINLAPIAFLDGGFAWRSFRALWSQPRWDPYGPIATQPARRGRALAVAAYYLGLAALFVLAMLETHVPQDRL